MAGAAQTHYSRHMQRAFTPSGCCLFPRFFISIRTAPRLCSTQLHRTGDYLNKADSSKRPEIHFLLQTN